MIRKHLLAALGLSAALLAGPVLAQDMVPTVSNDTVRTAHPSIITDPSNGQQLGSAAHPIPISGTVSTGANDATSTQTNATVTTHLTFQSALASSATRKGCLLVNTSNDQEYVYFGATGSATTANSIPLIAGQSISCASAAVVASDNLAVTSATTDGATFVVVSQ